MNIGINGGQLRGAIDILRFKARTLVKFRKRRGAYQKQLCFMHIGKTAGTSLQHALFEAMKGKKIFHESLPNFDSASAAAIAQSDLVIGHFAYQHVSKLRRSRFLFTFLRDPVQRVISNYYFLRTDSPESDYSRAAILAAKTMSLKEFLLCDDPRVRMITENFQAKSLAYDIRYQHQGAITDLRADAKRNLATFDFVGIVEHFDESVKALSRAIGRELTVKRLNVTRSRSEAPPASAHEMEIIRNLNEADLDIYERAKGRFERAFLD
jgi:hypothetical protein